MPLRRAPRSYGRQPLYVSPYRRIAHIVWAWGMPALLLFFALTRLVVWITERWWFQAIGQPEVFTRLFSWRCGAFFAAAAMYAAILGWNARTAWRISSHTSAPIGWGELWEAEGGSRLIPLEDKLGLDRYRQLATTLVIGLIACLAGSAAAGNFNIWLNAAYAGPTGIQDPFWQRDIGFSLFQLPALHALTSFVFWALLISLSLSGTIYIYEEAIELGGRRAYISPEAMRHLAGLLAAMVALKSISWRLDAWDIQSAASLTGTIQPGFFGYAAAHYRLPALLIGSWFAVPVAIGMLCLARAYQGRAVLALGLGFPLLTWLGAALVPMWVQANQNDGDGDNLEAGYRSLHIEATRQAWGLENMESRSLPITGGPTKAVEDKVVSDLPVWPPGAVQNELARQWRGQKSGLQITTIHLERWMVDGESRPVYVCTAQAPASLNTPTEDLAGLAVVDAQKTGPHGELVIYQAPRIKPDATVPLSPEQAPGVQLKSASQRLEFGLWPAPVRSDNDANRNAMERVPPDSTDNMLPPALYWTRSAPENESVETNSLVRRLLLAWRFMDLGLTGNTEPLQWHRQVVERCEQIAPFLRWTEADPRPVLNADGRLVWMLDAFATSRRYPNSSSPNIPGTFFTDTNYCRHIVTATVDSVTGETNLYLLDAREPFAALYARAFPGLFRDLTEMPAELRRQWRPSEALFSARAAVWCRVQGLEQIKSKSWRPTPLGSFDGRTTDTVYHAWTRPEARPFLPVGSLQIAAFQEIASDAKSSPNLILLRGITLGVDTALMDDTSALPPLYQWLPNTSVNIPADYAGGSTAGTLSSVGELIPTVRLAAALPLGSGAGVAGSIAKDTQLNSPVSFTTVDVNRGVSRDGNTRSVSDALVAPALSDAASGARAARRLEQVREAYRTFETARRRQDWRTMSESDNQLKKLLTPGLATAAP